LTLDGHASLTIGGDLQTFSMHYEGTIALDPDSSGGAVMSVGGILGNSGNLTINNGATDSRIVTQVTALALNNTGTIVLSGSNTAVLLVNGTVGSSGTVNIGKSARLTVAGNNVYDQIAGTTAISGTLTAGEIELAGGTLELASGGSIVGNLTFAGPSATLRLDATGFSNSIGGFAPGDNIDFAFLPFNSDIQAIWQENNTGTGGTLSLLQGLTTLTTLKLSGGYDSADFTASNLLGATQVTFTPGNPSGPNQLPPAGTTADMILRRGDGAYKIYDIGNNTISAGYQLCQVGTEWRFVGLGGFNGIDTTDMLLRSASTGGFEVYDISNNNITNAAFMGMVGLNWQVMGFGDFSNLGENDMILRNTGTGGIEVYDIRNNAITGAAFMGVVGLNWQVAGFSNHANESDLVLRDAGTGALEIYDITNNAISGAASLGIVGLDWQVSGFGDFSTRNEGDMLLRNQNTGALELYDISNNQITAAFSLGTIGLDWQFAGVAPIHAPGASDLVLRNVNTGAFEVYDIANNQLIGAAALGTVGLDWQLGGLGIDPPTGAMGSPDAQPGSTSQLVQAMAGFGGGSGGADTSNTIPLGADTSQQQLLTTPHA
jgi:hypothetical protein